MKPRPTRGRACGRPLKTARPRVTSYQARDGTVFKVCCLGTDVMGMQILITSKPDLDHGFEAPGARMVRSSVLCVAVAVSVATLVIFAVVPGAGAAPAFWMGWMGLTVVCVAIYGVGSFRYRHASGQSRRTQRWLKGR